MSGPSVRTQWLARPFLVGQYMAREPRALAASSTQFMDNIGSDSSFLVAQSSGQCDRMPTIVTTYDLNGLGIGCRTLRRATICLCLNGVQRCYAAMLTRPGTTPDDSRPQALVVLFFLCCSGAVMLLTQESRFFTSLTLVLCVLHIFEYTGVSRRWRHFFYPKSSTLRSRRRFRGI